MHGMQFAFVNNQRVPPLPGLSGGCPSCGSEMIAKCGIHRVHHWAHKSKRSCDSWWEPEKPWHRDWKNRFPVDWQEVVLASTEGERHIADVRSPHGVTIEFQHSAIRPIERAAREGFYKNMLWVVDGCRLARDWSRFSAGFSSMRQIGQQGIYLSSFPDELFSRNWINCPVPVLFDFEQAAQAGGVSHIAHILWCLLPGRVFGQAIIVALSKDDFVREALAAAEVIPVQTVLKNIADMLEHQRRAAQAAYVTHTQPWRRRRRNVRF